MNENYALHNTRLLKLPVDTSTFPVEQLIVDFDTNSLTLDFGSRCYLKRDNSARKPGKSHKCLIESKCEQRIKFILRAVEIFSEQLINKIKNQKTIYTRARSLMLFIDWSDTNNKSHFYEDISSAKAAIKLYFASIEERVKSGKLGHNTAVSHEKNLLNFFSNYFEVDNFQAGLRVLRHDSHLANRVTVPDEIHQKQVLSLTSSLFYSITKFVLNFEKYPFYIDIPNYLNWKDSKLWIFPNVVKFMHPDVQERRESLKRPNWIYDYKNGRVLTKSELQEQTGITLSQQNFNQVKSCFDKANVDKYDQHRVSLAMIAHNSFFEQFQAATGMNLAQIQNLTWDDNYKIESNLQGFRTIKARAKGKEVYFHIAAKFIKPFKEYLKLRRYLIGDIKEFNFLFLSMNRNGQLCKLNGHRATNSLFVVLRKIDPKIQKITSRNWRVKKSDFLINKTDISTAALLMQNSEETMKKHYSEGSETKAAEEMSDFFEKLSSTVDFMKNTDMVKTSAGECAEFGNPSIFQIDMPIKPDCKTPEGCFFCKHYKVHPDEIDVRKLLSLKFCILKTQHLSESIEHFELTLAPVVKRIEEILNFIEGRSKEYSDIIKRVTSEVFDEGQLDFYWARKYEMLVSVGYSR